MDVSTILATVDQYIKTNGNGEITGQLLQDVLHYIVNGLNGGKQDTLVSGTNIKTVGGKSMLGPGDLPVDNDLLYWGTAFQGGDNDMSSVEEITIGGVTYDDGLEFLEDTNVCKIGRVIAQINPTPITPGEGYDYHEITRFVITGIDSDDGYLTLGNVVSSPDITSIVKVSALPGSPDPNTQYIITE